MFKRTQYLAFLSAIISIAVALLLAGCPEQQPAPSGPSGEPPEVEQPEEATAEFQPAEEFEYLVDLESAVGKMMEADAMAMGADDEMLDEMREELEQVFNQEEITVEASDTIVRAHGEYSIDPAKLAEEIGENFPSELITGIGTAPVSFPTHFSADRRMMHLFVANPKLLGEIIVDLSMQFMDEVSGSMGGKEEDDGESGIRVSDLMLNMLDVDEPEELTDWLGDEMVLLLLTNPDYDPELYSDIEDLSFEEVIENLPIYPIIALAAEDSSQGLTIIENAVNFFFASGGARSEIERTEIEGVEAIMLPLETMADDMNFYNEQEASEFMTFMSRVGPSVAVAVPGYVLIGARPALLSALDAFDPDEDGEAGEATVQLAWNWDTMIEFYKAIDPMESIDWEEEATEVEREMVADLDEFIRDMGAVGMGVAELDMSETGDFTVDIVTSRESMGLIYVLSEIFEYGLGVEAVGQMSSSSDKPSGESESMEMDDEEEAEEPVEDESSDEADDASGERRKPGDE